jgi:ribosomal protein L40E
VRPTANFGPAAKKDASEMALCTKCGRQTDNGAESCRGCAGYQEQPASARQALAAPAATATADYLRPFALGGDGEPGLAEPAGDDWYPLAPELGTASRAAAFSAANSYPRAGTLSPPEPAEPPSAPRVPDWVVEARRDERLGAAAGGDGLAGYEPRSWPQQSREPEPDWPASGREAGPGPSGAMPGTGTVPSAGPLTAPGPLASVPLPAAAVGLADGASLMRGSTGLRRLGPVPPLYGPGAASPADNLLGRGRWRPLAAAAVAVAVIVAGIVVLSDQGKPPAGASGPGRPAADAPRHPAGHAFIAVAPAVTTQSRVPAVVSLLTRYFHAINAHDFAAYRKLFGPSLRSGLSARAFSTGYGSSRVSGVVLHALTSTGPRQVQATVTFISRQQAGRSVTRSGCRAWRISLYLRRHAGGYLIVSPPGEYAASASPCP